MSDPRPPRGHDGAPLRAGRGNASAATHLANARTISLAMRNLGDELRAEVEAARAAGAKWGAIAAAVGERPMRPDGASPTAMRRFYDRTAL